LCTAVALAGHVTSVEIVPELSAMAGKIWPRHRDNMPLKRRWSAWLEQQYL
jgi:hypothetical protein